MNWFVAKLVFRVICGCGNHTPQFDEQLRLICADDELHAFHKARLLGEGDGLNDTDRNNVGVKWKFIDVIELYSLAQPTDGAEICSAIKEEANTELYIRNIHKKATQLLEQGLHQFTGINSIAIGT
ncbi:MAG: DUF4288 domain-containing protein [Ferruginibacter sp.]